MIRTFNQHNIRKETELDGFWKVKLLSGNKKSEKEYHLLIPGTIQQVPSLGRFHGLASYERKVKIAEEGSYLLTFYGVSFFAEVFWDGEKVGSHYNAFSRFHIVLDQVEPGEHELKVLVSNEYSEASALHVKNDYESYNGVTRPVTIAKVPSTYLDYVHVTPKQTEKGYDLKIEARVCGNLELGGEVCIGAAGKSLSAVLEKGSNKVCGCLSFDAPEIETWSPENPALYEVEAVLKTGNETDDLIDRFGFRQVKVQGDKIYLNGQELFVKGFCRHEDAGNMGSALSPKQMAEDLMIMLEMNCNSVRTSHYPNDPRFLDMADELGILVWEENHARGLSEEQMRNPHFDEQCEECIDKMVTYDYNHPAIYVWGILNECASETEYGYQCYAKQFAQIRSLDASRPVTFSSCKNFKDLCFGLVDIVSFNVYPRWYHDEQPAKWVNALKEWIDTKTEGAGKPFILSEFGGGAIYGFHDYDRAKWSEERQADILDEQLSDFLSLPYVNGTYIWQFADCRVSEEIHGMRPKSENNKGVVDRYRRPKMAFDIVKKHYKDKN